MLKVSQNNKGRPIPRRYRAGYKVSHDKHHLVNNYKLNMHESGSLFLVYWMTTEQDLFELFEPRT